MSRYLDGECGGGGCVGKAQHLQIGFPMMSSCGRLYVHERVWGVCVVCVCVCVL